MPRNKKSQRYVPDTKLPRADNAWKMLDKLPAKYDWNTLIDIYENKFIPAMGTHNQFSREIYSFNKLKEQFRQNPADLANWKDKVPSWRITHLMRRALPFTPEFAELDSTFMEEYNSREDLQEIYKTATVGRYYIYDKFGAAHQKGSGTNSFEERPETFLMFADHIYNSIDAKTKIEESRDTPYEEGDLLLLRKPLIDRKYIDPLWVNPYSPEYRNGARTPDSSVPRIATLVNVTETVNDWRGAKGSRLLQVIWMGAPEYEGRIVKVEERYLKWHERPTLKNGLKKRDT